MKNNCGIYKIVNIINGKVYIGSSKNLNKRWCEHKRNLRKNNHDNNYLQKSWDKYGESSFKFEIIEIVDDVNNLITREQFYLDQLKPYDKTITYNICVTAGNMFGFKHSDETKTNFSKMRIGNTYSLGHKHTDETKNKMSESHFGKTHDLDTIKKLIIKSKKNNLTSKKNKTTCPNNIKLEIIEKYKTGEFSTRELAKIYSISKSSIWNIVRV